jgi:DNA primase
MQRNDDIPRVLQATDIVRLIGEQVALKRKGAEFVCVCPFHDDHAPSMYVSPRKQIYKCFSCGAGGDALKFVIEYHKMTFGEALRHLADRAGLKLTPFVPRTGAGGAGFAHDGGAHTGDDEGAQGATRDEIAGANRSAAKFFQVLLAHPQHGQAGREVLEKRGVSAQMVERFALGVAPDRWDGLMKLVQDKGLDERAFAAAGLLKTRESGGRYDAFRHRVIFPIHDLTDRVIAFGARKIRAEDEPKYLNSPESALFVKGHTLYALPQAKEAIRASGVAIVVEGYMDAIACHQAGVCNVVATLGTALTVPGARLLGRVLGDQTAKGGGRVVLLFDGDAAGQRAADRAIEVLFNSDLDIRIATLAGHTDAKDPDELLKRPSGKDVLARVLEASEEALSFRFARLRQRLAGLGLQARGAALEEEIEKVAQLGLGTLSPVRQQLIVRYIADLAGVAPEVVRAAVTRARPRRRADEQEQQDRDGAGTDDLMPRDALEWALAHVVYEPSILGALSVAQRELLSPDRFARGAYKQIARWVDELATSGQPLTSGALRALAGYDDMGQLVLTLQADIDRNLGRASGAASAEADALAHNASRELALTCARKLLDEAAAAMLAARADAVPDQAARLEQLRAAHAAPGRRPLGMPRSKSTGGSGGGGGGGGGGLGNGPGATGPGRTG